MKTLYLKKILILITILLLGVTILTGCVTRQFYYCYDELMDGLISVEIIYMEESVTFFEIHWYTEVSQDDYEVIRELTSEESQELVRALSRTTFTYFMPLIPASWSAIYSMEGYAIKLNYGSSYIIVAQTGDYRPSSVSEVRRRLPQMTAGRTATDEDWNRLITGDFAEESVLSNSRIRVGLGFSFLMIFLIVLVRPYLGRIHIYPVSTWRTAIEIPRARKYSLSIMRKRSWLLSGYSNLSHAFSKTTFTVTHIDTGEAIKLVPTLRILSKRGERVVILIGHFQAPGPGRYIVESHPESQFIQEDQMMIRSYINPVIQKICIAGIIISGIVFIRGLS